MYTKEQETRKEIPSPADILGQVKPDGDPEESPETNSEPWDSEPGAFLL